MILKALINFYAWVWSIEPWHPQGEVAAYAILFALVIDMACLVGVVAMVARWKRGE